SFGYAWGNAPYYQSGGAILIDAAAGVHVFVSNPNGGSINFNGSVITDTLFIAKFDAGGGFVSSFPLTAGVPSLNAAGELTLFTGTAWSKYDSLGNLLYSRSYPQDPSLHISANGGAVSSVGDVAVVGRFDGTANFGTGTPLTSASSPNADIFVVKF